LSQGNEPSPLLIVAILTIHSGAAESFREYETKAAGILSRYGGVIERTVVIEPAGPEQRMRILVTPESDRSAISRQRKTELHHRPHPQPRAGDVAPESVPQGQVFRFTMESTDCKINPGIAREPNTFAQPHPAITSAGWGLR